MLKSRHLLMFVLVLGLGLMIEGLKSLRNMTSAPPDKLSALAMKGLDSNPFHLTAQQLKKTGSTTKGNGLRLSAERGQTMPEQYDFSEGHKVAQGAAAPTEKDKSKAEADKAKKKKKSARGKKKNDKSKSDSDYAQNPYKTDKKKSPLTSTIESQNENPTATQGPTQKEDKLPITFDDWAKLILGRPQPENVTKLVEFFSNRMVTAEVFYTLLTALVEESDPQQHILAVYAAGQFPNPRSFSFLVNVIEKDGGGGGGPKALEQVNAYQSLHHVSHLKTVLATHLADGNQVQVAISLIDRSTQLFLEAPRSPTAAEPARGGQGPNSPAVDPATLEANQRRAQAKHVFASFKPIIEQVIAAYGQEPTIAAQATKILERLKNLAVVVADLND
jgi:hypothetical protein